MNKIAASPLTHDGWRTLADRERSTAHTGGAVWQAFVRECERTTGLPWNVIREILDPYQREHFAAIA